MQDVGSILSQSFPLVNLTSYHIVGDSLEKSQLSDVIGNNLMRILLGLHSASDHEHAKTYSPSSILDSPSSASTATPTSRTCR